MRVVNNTAWKTEHLRAVAARVARESSAAVRKRAVITFNYSRGRGTSGLAWVGGRNAIVRLPSPMICARERKQVNMVDLAITIAHELAHLEELSNERRMRHGDSIHGHGEVGRRHWAWAKDMPLEPKAQRGRPKLTSSERAERELMRVDEGIKRWESKKRRADNALAKLKRQRRYYERRLAAMPARTEGAGT